MPSSKYMKVPTTPAGAAGGSTNISADSAGSMDDRTSGDLAVTVGSINNGIPSADSSQQLIADTESATSIHTSNSRQYNGNGGVQYSEWFAMFVLCFVNLINYMDRYTIAGK